MAPGPADEVSPVSPAPASKNKINIAVIHRIFSPFLLFPLDKHLPFHLLPAIQAMPFLELTV